MEQIAPFLSLSASNARTEKSMDTRKGDALWELFAGMYGSKLVSQFGDECPMAWHRTLADLTHMEISRGIRWLREEGREWPPSATEFYALCRKVEPPRPGPMPKMLPEPPEVRQARRERGLQEMARIKEMLR